ncbi:tight adherence pilus pseudopilin TadF [Orbus sturtevantii]|uniref:tight adherence pilus pseudopilin TadF n=1 Tax=Orbus sturtevantii TaxID=3074109 RepID=UPI00370CFEE3
MIITNLRKFINNKKGVLSIEFAVVFFIFIALTYVVYDIYSSIMLQNKLDRATYTVASLFRERTSLYPTIDDTTNGNIDPSFSLCSKQSTSCFETKELLDQKQVDEMQKLAKKLLNRNVAIKIDSLFILQNVDFPADLNQAKLVSVSGLSCNSSVCNNDVKNYFDSLPNIAGKSGASLADYTKLVPYVSRVGAQAGINGRWIPLYRINVCITNNESLYLKLFDRTRSDSNILPNLCSEAVVISRCNDLGNVTKNCPIYL